MVSGAKGVNDTEIIIPYEYEGKPVTVIGEGAFENMEGITSVFIPEGVTAIHGFAFHRCPALISISIPDSVSQIALTAFNRSEGIRRASVRNHLPRRPFRPGKGNQEQ